MKLINIITFLLLSIPFISQGQIYVNQNASGANNGNSWTDAYTDLQDAIQSSSVNDEIWIASGTYFPSNTGDTNASFTIGALSLYGGFDGTESSPAERDLEANETILSGDYNGDDLVEVTTGPLALTFSNTNENAKRIIHGSGIAGLVRIDGLTIKGGRNLSTGGGALFSPDGQLELYVTNCNFINNYASGTSGALRFGSGSQENLLCYVRNTNFINNKCEGGGAKGGAIWATGPGVSNINYTNCLFKQNHSGGRGGAITNDLAVIPTYTNCVFTENRSTHGGAVHENAVENVYYHNCVFHKNSASNGGSAISNFGDFGNFNVYLFNSIFFDNDEDPLYGESGNPFVISNCILDASNFSEVISGAVGSQNVGGNQYAIDPLFVDASNFDYNLTEDSPAINIGNNTLTTATTDFTGYISRIVDNTIDMGAFEYHIPLTAEIVAETAACFGVENGTATVEAINSYPSLQYYWESNGTSGNNLNSLMSGIYDLTVTNAIGDFVVLDFFIADNPEIVATSTSTPENNFSEDGTATVSPSGGTGPFTFEWNTTPVQTEATAIGLITDIYTVTITDSNGCTLELDLTVGQVSAVLSIDEASPIKVQPNPFNDAFEIDIPFDFHKMDTPTQVLVYNTSGQLVLHQALLLAGKSTLEMDGLSAGVYILVLECADQQFRKKMIKQ